MRINYREALLKTRLLFFLCLHHFFIDMCDEIVYKIHFVFYNMEISYEYEVFYYSFEFYYDDSCYGSRI
uniref:Uncharacterized protein n=1 Tax=Bartonella rochalimae ATCC BAA-1498 TaxID=685782 RepID=E6YK62_9HYPH|nr:hypothetical protein BARRO_10183 [Bartonella rochalimae ATCC BAA-1498]